jgi:hypothetical protein
MMRQFYHLHVVVQSIFQKYMYAHTDGWTKVQAWQFHNGYKHIFLKYRGSQRPALSYGTHLDSSHFSTSRLDDAHLLVYIHWNQCNIRYYIHGRSRTSPNTSYV